MNKNCQTLGKPRCLIVDEWINKKWYIRKQNIIQHLKINEVSVHEKKEMNFKCIIVNLKS